MALSEYVLPPVLQGLLPCRLWQEDRQKWRLHQVRLLTLKAQVITFDKYIALNCFASIILQEVPSSSKEVPNSVHL